MTRDCPGPDSPLLSAFLDEALEDDEQQALRVHLAGCAACTEEVERLRRLDDALGEATRPDLSADPGPAYWEALPQRVLEQALGRPAHVARPHRGLTTGALAGALAASLVWLSLGWLRPVPGALPGGAPRHDLALPILASRPPQEAPQVLLSRLLTRPLGPTQVEDCVSLINASGAGRPLSETQLFVLGVRLFEAGQPAPAISAFDRQVAVYPGGTLRGSALTLRTQAARTQLDLRLNELQVKLPEAQVLMLRRAVADAQDAARLEQVRQQLERAMRAARQTAR